MTEVALRGELRTLHDKIVYARELAGSGMLPAQYRDQPANILWAIEYGQMLGLPAMAAITGVHLIEGKPSASAGLISALVRRAGHTLRVGEHAGGAWAEIVRCDDRSFTFRVEWSLQRAERAGLLGKKNWKLYPEAMLTARAISQVARNACEECLFGLHYTPEEMGATDTDEEGVPLQAAAVRGDRPTPPAPTPAAPAPASATGVPPTPSSPWPRLGELFEALSVTREQIPALTSALVGRELTSATEMNSAEIADLTATLERMAAEPDAQTLLADLLNPAGERDGEEQLALDVDGTGAA